MNVPEIKERMIFQLINFTGNGKKVKSEELQDSIFREVNAHNDVIIRKIFREIVEDEYRKPEPKHLYGSSTKGFFEAKTEKEAEEAINFIYDKLVSLSERLSRMKKTYKKITDQEYQRKLF